MGDALELETPLPVPNADYPGSLRVRLGYLLSTRPDQGTLNISTVGGCEAYSSFRSGERKANPFPRVLTDGLQSKQQETLAYLSGASPGFSITVDTQFRLGRRKKGVDNSPAACRLRISHLPSSKPRSNRSRVRIDWIAYSWPNGQSVMQPPTAGGQSRRGGAPAGAVGESFDRCSS